MLNRFIGRSIKLVRERQFFVSMAVVASATNQIVSSVNKAGSVALTFVAVSGGMVLQNIVERYNKNKKINELKTSCQSRLKI